MKSKVHPRYKTKYRVANWAAYNQALVRRGDVRRCCMNTLWGWGRASWAGCGPDVRRGGQTLIMGYSADKSPLIGHLAGPLRRLEPLGAQRQEKCGPNRPTPTGYSCNNATSRRPDYRLSWSEQDILFEVKEFRAEADDFGTGFGFFDPYPPLREKIDAARVKFKGLKQYCCCLVLYNRDKPLVLLDWRHVYGAMLGKLGFSVPIHVTEHPAPEGDAINSIFMSGGKMHKEHQGVAVAPQNQTISAILVLGRVPVGDRLFHADLREREVRQGRKFALEERLRELEASQGTARDARRWPLRVVVHENPYARVLLPAELFRGPHDERYGGRDGGVQRLFQGDEIARLPKARD